MSTVNLNDLLPNPSNPRVIKDHQYARLLDSIKRDPQFLAKRPIVHADGVILGGNMRFRALQEATRDPDFRAAIGTKKEGEVPASWVLDASEFSEEQRRRFVIVDNAPDGMSGEWDWDKLANEWDEEMLDLCGMEIPCVFDVDEASTPELSSGDKSPIQQMTFTLHDEQVEEVKAAIEKAKKAGYGQSAVNENSNGNALAWIAQAFNRG